MSLANEALTTADFEQNVCEPARAMGFVAGWGAAVFCVLVLYWVGFATTGFLAYLRILNLLIRFGERLGEIPSPAAGFKLKCKACSSWLTKDQKTLLAACRAIRSRWWVLPMSVAVSVLNALYCIYMAFGLFGVYDGHPWLSDGSAAQSLADGRLSGIFVGVLMGLSGLGVFWTIPYVLVKRRPASLLIQYADRLGELDAGPPAQSTIDNRKSAIYLPPAQSAIRNSQSTIEDVQ